MFSKQHRLHEDQDLSAVFKGGKSVFDPACGMKFKKNSKDASRFAVVVGTKVHKSAVKRNRIRRQYREIVKAHMDEIKPGFDVVMLTGKKALGLDYKEKEQRLLRVLKKAGLLTSTL